MGYSYRSFDKNDETTVYIIVYLMVFVVTIPLISQILDSIGVLDNLVYKLGDQAHHYFMLHFLVHKEHKKHIKEYSFHGNNTSNNSSSSKKTITKGFNNDKNDKDINSIEDNRIKLIEEYEEYDNECFDEDESKDIEADIDNKIIVSKEELEQEAQSIKIRSSAHITYGKCCGKRIHSYDPRFTITFVELLSYYNTANDSKNSRLSDCLFYILNSHSIISTFAALPGNPFSRYERRMAFIVRHSAAFLITIFFSRLSSLSIGSQIALSLLFITPLTIFVNETYYFVVAPERVFPCLKFCCNHDDDIEEKNTIRKIFHCLNVLGSFFAHCACAISILWVVLAGLWTSSDIGFRALGKYWLQVMILSLGGEMLHIWLKFFSSEYCIHLKFNKLKLAVLSKWFYEYIKMEQLEVIKTRKCLLCFQLVIYTTTGKSIKALDEVELEKVLEEEPAVIVVNDIDENLHVDKSRMVTDKKELQNSESITSIAIKDTDMIISINETRVDRANVDDERWELIKWTDCIFDLTKVWIR